MRYRPGTVETLGKNTWRVTIAGRAYSATYDDNPETFPLDRWKISNSRGQVTAWDSRLSADVQNAIRNASPIR